MLVLLTLIAVFLGCFCFVGILYLLGEPNKDKGAVKVFCTIIAIEALLIWGLCYAWSSFNNGPKSFEYIPIETKGNLTYYCYNDKIIQLIGDQSKVDVNKYVMKVTTYPAGYHLGLYFDVSKEWEIAEKPKSLESP